MNPAYARIIAASDADRRDLFATTAKRTDQNVEKGYWLFWTLDALFNRRPWRVTTCRAASPAK